MIRVLSSGVVWCIGILAIVTVAAAAEPEGWGTDFEQAKKAATEKKLPILMDFSGSDWCIWCQRLDAEVFSQKAFIDYAKDNLILFLVDFPMRAQQADALRAQNRQLQSTYRVAGYPTVVLVNAQGEELARSDYRKGGAEAYVEHLKELVAGKKPVEPAAAGH